MRVLLLSKRFDFGGSENHVCELADGLAERGHHVVLAAGDGRQKKRLLPEVVYHPLRFSDWRSPMIIRFLFRLIREHGIEIIHAHQRLAVRLGCLTGLWAQVPVVVTVHGRTRHDLGSRFFRRIPARVIFVSRHVMARADRFRELIGKSVYIPNSIAGGGFAAGNDERLYYLSRIDKHHGRLLLMLIEKVLPLLLCRRPQLKLEIIGDGRYAVEVKAAAQKLNCSVGGEAVICRGFRSDIADCLARGGVLLGVGRAAAMGAALGVTVLSVNDRHLGPVLRLENLSRLQETNFVAVEAPPPVPETLYGRLVEALEQAPTLCERQLLSLRLMNELDPQKIIAQVEDLYHAVLCERESVRLPRFLTADARSMRLG